MFGFIYFIFLSELGDFTFIVDNKKPGNNAGLFIN